MKEFPELLNEPKVSSIIQKTKKDLKSVAIGFPILLGIIILFVCGLNASSPGNATASEIIGLILFSIFALLIFYGFMIPELRNPYKVVEFKVANKNAKISPNRLPELTIQEENGTWFDVWEGKDYKAVEENNTYKMIVQGKKIVSIVE